MNLTRDSGVMLLKFLLYVFVIADFKFSIVFEHDCDSEIIKSNFSPNPLIKSILFFISSNCSNWVDIDIKKNGLICTSECFLVCFKCVGFGQVRSLCAKFLVTNRNCQGKWWSKYDFSLKTERSFLEGVDKPHIYYLVEFMLLSRL